MYGYDEELAEQCEAIQDAMEGDYAASVMGGGPKSGVFPRPLNPSVEVPGRPVDDPLPQYEPEPLEMPPDPGPPPSQPTTPLEPPETYPELESAPEPLPEAPEVLPEAPETLPEVLPEAPVEGGELLEEGELLLEGGETAVEGVELAEGGAALGELAPVAAAGIAGYMLGDAIAPYVYGDKNLDGSPVVKYESVDDIDTNYKDTWAYKINQWLDD